MPQYIDIVFDAPPSPEGSRLIEVEDDTGASISMGEWVERPDGRWALRLRSLPIANVRPSDLEPLIVEYLATLNNNDHEEQWESSQSYARNELTAFFEWLEKRGR